LPLTTLWTHSRGSPFADEQPGKLDIANGEAVLQLRIELNDVAPETLLLLIHPHSHAEYAHGIVNPPNGALVTERACQVPQE
jgi:putative ABC transport system ATP-binding protein